MKSIAKAGINLTARHYQTIVDTQPAINWFEVHPERYFGERSSLFLQNLEQIRQYYPITFHGVGLSLGSTDPINAQYLLQLKTLMQCFQPAWFSEHLSWASVNGQHFHELLPLPYTPEAVKHVVQRIQQVQDFLEQRILVENISSYLAYKGSVLSEAEFIQTVVEQADCFLLLDVNNLYVNSKNHGFDPIVELNKIPIDRVRQIHLAGYSDRENYLLDTHGESIHPPVWQLYQAALDRFGAVPTLIEWENNVPDLEIVKAEADQADRYLMQVAT